MTITYISPGVWELRSRHGTVIATGDLYTTVKVWAKLRRDGRSDLSYEQPRADGQPTTERTTVDAARAPPANLLSRPRRGPERVRSPPDLRGRPSWCLNSPRVRDRSRSSGQVCASSQQAVRLHADVCLGGVVSTRPSRNCRAGDGQPFEPTAPACGW